jgi:hypothetical protein
VYIKYILYIESCAHLSEVIIVSLKMLFKPLFALSVLVNSVLCRPTPSLSAIENIFHTIGPRQPPPNFPAQNFHLIGFEGNEVIQVRQAIADAQWLGIMGLQHLNGITNVNQLTPEFRTYFGNNFDATNLDTIRNVVNSLATIGTNGMLGFVIRSPTASPQRPNALARVQNRTMTIFPRFFQQPAIDRFTFLQNDNTNFDVINFTSNRATTIAHEIMHYRDNDFGQDQATHIGDMTWARVNDPSSPTYNGAFPTSVTPVLYTPERANQLAQLGQDQAMRNAANYQWFLWGEFSDC